MDDDFLRPDGVDASLAGCWPFYWCALRGAQNLEAALVYGTAEACRRVAVLRGPGACVPKGGGWSEPEVRILAEGAADYLRGTRRLLGRADADLGAVWALPAQDFLPPERQWPRPAWRWRPRLWRRR